MSRESYNVENQESKALAEGVRVCALCKVEKFNAATMTVDVQPLSKALDGGVYRTPPPVLGVPVAMIRGGGFFLRPWYKAGDVGVLIYADHDIDRIAEAGQECQPNTERNHGDEDAIFLGAFIPKSKPVTGVPDEALVMATDGGGLQVCMEKDTITVKNGGTTAVFKDSSITMNTQDVTISASGTVTIQGGTVNIN